MVRVQGSGFRVQAAIGLSPDFASRVSARLAATGRSRARTNDLGPAKCVEGPNQLSRAKLGSKLLHIVASGKHQVELQALGKRSASSVALPQRGKVVRHVQVNLSVTGRTGRAFGEKLFGLLVFPSR